MNSPNHPTIVSKMAQKTKGASRGKVVGRKTTSSDRGHGSIEDMGHPTIIVGGVEDLVISTTQVSFHVRVHICVCVCVWNFRV